VERRRRGDGSLADAAFAAEEENAARSERVERLAKVHSP
jgi:hypothetical protein